MEATAYEPITTHELIRALQRYQSDKAHSRSLEERWLCTAIQPALDAACEVGNSRLGEASRKAANAFRAAELEREIEQKRRDVAALERDLKKVHAA